jgi:hypothetical protein
MWSYFAPTPEFADIAFARQHILCARYVDRHPELSRNPRQRVAMSRIPETEFRNFPRLPHSAIGTGVTGVPMLGSPFIARRVLELARTANPHGPNSLHGHNQLSGSGAKRAQDETQDQPRLSRNLLHAREKAARALRVRFPQTLLHTQSQKYAA